MGFTHSTDDPYEHMSKTIPAWAAASDVAGQPTEPPPQRDDVVETWEDERRCGAVHSFASKGVASELV